MKIDIQEELQPILSALTSLREEIDQIKNMVVSGGMNESQTPSVGWMDARAIAEQLQMNFRSFKRTVLDKGLLDFFTVGQGVYMIDLKSFQRWKSANAEMPDWSKQKIIFK